MAGWHALSRAGARLMLRMVDPSPALRFARQRGRRLKNRTRAAPSTVISATFHNFLFGNPHIWVCCYACARRSPLCGAPDWQTLRASRRSTTPKAWPQLPALRFIPEHPWPNSFLCNAAQRLLQPIYRLWPKISLNLSVQVPYIGCICIGRRMPVSSWAWAMLEENVAIRLCLAHKARLEARLARASGSERERLRAEILAGVRLIERLRREASCEPPIVTSPRSRAPRACHLRLVASSWR